MQQNQMAAFAIQCMACVLTGFKPQLPCADFDWVSFKDFCEKHCISNIVAYCINDLDILMPKEIKKYFNEIVFQSMAKEALVEVETSLICDEFEKNNIEHMLLKGSVLKNFYPQPDMRSMCDTDILIGDKLDEAVDLMKGLGYSFKSRDNLHDCYNKKPFLNVELHNALFDKELESLYSYFKTGFERAQKAEGFSSQYILSDEDFYIFIIAHFAKHFQRTGTGIRSVADVFVFIKSHKDMNFDYISTELEKLNLFKFSKHIEDISRKWFSLGEINEGDSVEQYIISSGAFGDFLNLELNRFLQSNSFSGSHSRKKLSYYLKVIFPGNEYMSARYPLLKKKKFLLPLFWVYRIFYTLFKSTYSIKFRLKGVSDSDENSADKFKDFN